MECIKTTRGFLLRNLLHQISISHKHNSLSLSNVYFSWINLFWMMATVSQPSAILYQEWLKDCCSVIYAASTVKHPKEFSLKWRECSAFLSHSCYSKHFNNLDVPFKYNRENIWYPCTWQILFVWLWNTIRMHINAQWLEC